MPSELVAPIGVIIIVLVLALGAPRKRDVHEMATRCKDKVNQIDRVSCELGEKSKRDYTRLR